MVVSVFLFGKPGWEIQRLEGSDVDSDLLDEVASCGRDIGKRMGRVAELGRRLLESGWRGSGGLYDIDFYKAVSLKEAQEELGALGIEHDEVTIREETEDSGSPGGD